MNVAAAGWFGAVLKTAPATDNIERQFTEVL